MKRSYAAGDHCFVICAYEKSPYLEKCIRSVLGQELQTRVCMVSSTPNGWIGGLAEKYGIPLYINPVREGIAGDWNFALARADTPLVTLAHQDDLYAKSYSRRMLEAVNGAEKGLIAFSDYIELRGGGYVHRNVNLLIKRCMLFPLLLPGALKSRWLRRRILSFGNPICCPSVTYLTENLPKPLFTGDMKSNIDWQAWEEISRLPGSFIYVRRPLICHRIHADSETSRLLKKNRRCREDLYVLARFWPPLIAGLLEKIYRLSERSNDLQRADQAKKHTDERGKGKYQ